MRQDFRTEVPATHRKYLVLALLSVSGGTFYVEMESNAERIKLPKSVGGREFA